MSKFEEAMAMYAEVHKNWTEESEEVYQEVLDFIYANGFTESEVYDYCISEGLMKYPG